MPFGGRLLAPSAQVRTASERLRYTSGMTTPQDTPQKFIGYCRVSSEGQGASGLGLEAQEAAIRSYAIAHNLDLVEVVVEVDSAISGDRPVRFETFSRCGRGEASGVIVASQSRISRSVVETAALLAWVERKNIRLVMLDCSVDTGTAAGKMVAQILAAVAENEADQISERTKSALAAKRAKGEAISRPRVEGQVADLILEMKNNGLGVRAIVRELNERQIPTARGGQQWHSSAVQRTLGYKRPKRRVTASLPS